jgi:signal transduction histidine kinase
MRGLLGVLRSDERGTRSPRPTLAQLETLLAEARRGGRLVDLEVEGERRPLAGGIELTAYRVLQHALVAVRGGNGEAATIGVHYLPDALELRVVGFPADGGSAEAALLARASGSSRRVGASAPRVRYRGDGCCGHACRRSRRMAERFSPARILASRWLDPVLAIALTAASLAELYTSPDLTGSPQAAVVVVLLGALLVVRRSHPVPATCVAGAILAATTQYDEGFLPGLSYAVPSLLAYSCGAHASRAAGLVGALIAAVGAQVGVGFEEFPNFEIYLRALVPWWVGRQVRRRPGLVSELAVRTAQLEAEQDAFTGLAVRRERARIARELHDIVAHHLAVIVVQAGAGRLADAGQTDRAAERFTTIGESGGEALREMARLVDILDADRRHTAGGLGRLRALLDEAEAGGLEVRFTPLPSGVRVRRRWRRACTASFERG